MPLSNELEPSAYCTREGARITSSSSKDVQGWVELTKTYMASISIDTSAVTVLSIPEGTALTKGMVLKAILLLQLKQTRENVLAETWLEGVYEYGVGQDERQAIIDLLISLAEYFRVLNKKKKQLGDSARMELDVLRRLIRFEKPGTSTGK